MTEHVIDREAIARTEQFADSLPLDGTLVDLDTTIKGKDISLMARHIEYPFSHSLLFNLFGTDPQGVVNVGFMDWTITQTEALCEHQQRYVVPSTFHETLAVKKYSRGAERLQGFLIYEDFRKNHLGNFLIAVSLRTLKRLG